MIGERLVAWLGSAHEIEIEILKGQRIANVADDAITLGPLQWIRQAGPQWLQRSLVDRDRATTTFDVHAGDTASFAIFRREPSRELELETLVASYPLLVQPCEHCSYLPQPAASETVSASQTHGRNQDLRVALSRAAAS